MAAFYQMLVGQGRLGDVRMFSPRLISYVTRNHTGERGDDAMTGTVCAFLAAVFHDFTKTLMLSKRAAR